MTGGCTDNLYGEIEAIVRVCEGLLFVNHPDIVFIRVICENLYIFVQYTCIFLCAVNHIVAVDAVQMF